MLGNVRCTGGGQCIIFYCLSAPNINIILIYSTSTFERAHNFHLFLPPRPLTNLNLFLPPRPRTNLNLFLSPRPHTNFNLFLPPRPHTNLNLFLPPLPRRSTIPSFSVRDSQQYQNHFSPPTCGSVNDMPYGCQP